MAIGAPKSITACQRFFREPELPRQRQYEALRAYFLEGKPSGVVAEEFGYTRGSFRVLCHHFRRDPAPHFFIAPVPGPRNQPKKSRARQMIVQMRKQNHSVYEISEALKERGTALSPTAVREVLKEEGFAPLPRRLDEERCIGPRPTVELVADVRSFAMAPRSFTTRCGGLFLFIPDLVRLQLDQVAKKARLPSSRMIPRTHALRAALALKLWGVERKSHIMVLVADEGLALFSGLNCSPKRSWLCEFSSRIDHDKTIRMLTLWHKQILDEPLGKGDSINLDFHSVPYYGEDPTIERHYVSARSRRQPSILVFLAQDADERVFCYSNADIRKGEESEEIFRFISFWKRVRGRLPPHLVFDSRLTTYAGLARLDRMDITFITLRRRSPRILDEIQQLPSSAWRRVTLDVPTRKYRTPRVYEKNVSLAGRQFRQMYIKELGHDDPTVLLTNDTKTSTKNVITRYARRMLIENAISDAIRFFHMDALSSTVGLKVDFDMALLVIASALYRLQAKRMRGYADSQARHLFRDIIDTPADVHVTGSEVTVELHRRAHLPIILASGLMDRHVTVPWRNNARLRLTTYNP